MTRHCSGGSDTNSRCGFSFPEKDDWKWFLVDGKKVGKDGYEAAIKKMRDIPAFGMGDASELG
jgi:hypothetical protein